MSKSVVLQVEEAICALLAATGTPAPVDRQPIVDYDEEQLPSISVAFMGWKNADGEHDSIEQEAEWGILCRAVGSATVPCTEAVDALTLWVHRQLMDNTLGGLARHLLITQGAVQYDRKSDVSTIQVQLDVKATLDIQRGDPSQNYNTGG